ncbi:ATP-binding protein [Streptomonospora salina]|nr:ATP-binding protein [Streptomonospora salina]
MALAAEQHENPGVNGSAPAKTRLSLPHRIPATNPDLSSVFFGHERDQIKLARSWCWRTTGLAYDRAYPILLALSEIYTNAIKHTASGLPGGRVRIDITRLTGNMRLAVTDQGLRPERPVTLPEPRPTCIEDIEEAGRGLSLVEAVSRRWGWEGNPGDPLTVWALFDRNPSHHG